MTPMLEKIARAIHAYRQTQGYGGQAGWEFEPSDIQRLHLETARAALQALRQPDEAMIEAGVVAALVAFAEHGITPDVQEVLVHGDNRGTIAPHAMRKAEKASFTTMINTVLGEGE